MKIKRKDKKEKGNKKKTWRRNESKKKIKESKLQKNKEIIKLQKDEKRNSVLEWGNWKMKWQKVSHIFTLNGNEKQFEIAGNLR